MTGPILNLFAGPGGWCEGARIAGYSGWSVGIEHDLPACRTAVAAGHPRVCADVATYPLHVFRDVDGLIASPPCPTFSAAGQGAGRHLTAILCTALTRLQRGRNGVAEAVHFGTQVLRAVALAREPKWTRAQRSEWARRQARMSALVLQPLRYTLALQPRWIALEQVDAVQPIWNHMAVVLRELGYRVWTGVLSAERYGVPQTRKRAILVARCDGLPVGPPSPTHQAYRAGQAVSTEPDLFGDPLPPPVSMAEALGWGMTGRPSVTVVTVRPGGGSVLDGGTGTREVFDRAQATGGWAMRNGNQANACERRACEPAGTLFFGQRTNAVDWVMDRPATTVQGDPRIAPPGHRDRDGGEPQFGEHTVRVTVQEAAMLQSFRPDYPWKGTKTQKYQQVGNAVPPLLAAAVLRSLLVSSVEGAAA